MKFNIFADIFHGKQNELAPTFKGKIKDTFDVINGNDADERKFGLIDYITLFTTVLIRSLFMQSFNYSFKEVILIATGNQIKGRLLSPLSIPVFVTLALILGVLIGLRNLISATLTLISLPIVALVHLISNASKKGTMKAYINNAIQAAVNSDNNSVTINPPEHLNLIFDQDMTDYFIEQLNNQLTIVTLTLPDDFRNAQNDLLDNLKSELKYVTSIDYECALIPESNRKNLDSNISLSSKAAEPSQSGSPVSYVSSTKLTPLTRSDSGTLQCDNLNAIQSNGFFSFQPNALRPLDQPALMGVGSADGNSDESSLSI